jgi:hypothetical protein
MGEWTLDEKRTFDDYVAARLDGTLAPPCALTKAD